MSKLEKELEVDSPRKCINRYCLRHCGKMERKNSKRSVAECVNRECPLHPYRTGQLRSRGPLSDYMKNRRVVKLRTARRKIDRLTETINKANEKINVMEAKTAAYREQKREAELDLEKARENLDRIEVQFSDELEAGLWK